MERVGGLMQQTRTFESKTPMLLYLIVGGTALFAAVLLAFEKSITLAAVILLGALIYLGREWYISQTTTVVCDEEGLSITRSSRRHGSRTERHRWAEVTGTEFYYTTQSREGKEGDETSHTGHFAIAAEQGTVLDWSDRAGFDELMATVNERTPHLDYVWVKREEATGAILDDRGPYVAVQR